MPFTEDNLKRELTLILELENQSDRGVAIIGTAWLEEQLQVAIKSRLEDDKATWSRLFENSGPIATFSARIDLARLLGIVDQDVYSDLQMIRKIRNDFAHWIAAKDHVALTFETQHISDRCLNLKSIKFEGNGNPRRCFVRTCAVLNADLYIYTLSGFEQIKVRLSNDG